MMSSRVFQKVGLIPFLVAVCVLPLACQSGLDTPPAPPPPGATAGKRPPTELEKLFTSALAGDKSVVPKLEAAFQSATLPKSKDMIASVLLRAGVRDPPIYFDYLAAEARIAIDAEDGPEPLVRGGDGKLVKGKWNPEFLEWCKKRGLNPREKTMEIFYETPGKVLFLASSGDPRGYPLLVKGVHSKNYGVSIVSANGLAVIGDPRAIDEIVAACREAPAQEASSIAWALVFFNDPRAQRAAEEFITDKQVLTAVRSDAAKHGTKAFFGW